MHLGLQAFASIMRIHALASLHAFASIIRIHACANTVVGVRAMADACAGLQIYTDLMDVSSNVPGKLQTAMASMMQRHFESGSSQPYILFLAKSVKGLEKADLPAVSANADVIGHVFRLFNGRLPTDHHIVQALQTLGVAYDGDLSKGFEGSTQNMFFEVCRVGDS